MIGTYINEESPVRGPVFKDVVSILETATSGKQLKGEITVGLPFLVVACDTGKLTQFPKSTHQASQKWTARLAVMNDTHYGRLRKRTLDHGVSFEYIRRQAKHGELKFRIFCG